MKLTNSELKVMTVLWDMGDMNASDLYKILGKKVGWNRNTSYTIIKKCVEKGFIQRIEPSFFCKVLLSKEEAQTESLKDLINKLFANSKIEFYKAFFKAGELSEDEVNELKDIVNKLR